MAKKNKQLKLTLVRSRFGRGPVHMACVAGLGLRNRHQAVVVSDTPAIRGMVDKVSYLLKIEEL
jgi:large subunit ribosomal protein L30